VSRYGLIALGSSQDQIGPLTRTVYDAALVLSAIAGHDPQDATSCAVSVKDYTSGLSTKLPATITIGLVDNMLNAEGIDTTVHKALTAVIEQLVKLGARTRTISLPMLEYGAAVYFIINRAEAASNLARFDGVKYGLRSKENNSLQDMYLNTRTQGFGAEVRRRILTGNYVLSVGHADKYYTKAVAVQQRMRAEFIDAFTSCDLLLMPTNAAGAFKIGELTNNTLQMGLQDYFVAHANITGMPSITVPCGFTAENLPIGFQLAGPAFSEELLLQVAYAYEQATEWHTKYPTLSGVAA
jgi:aspartyl-tRNA(Asn)/glutamyl-tRNA(Gln) amidotransferase subunit A